MEKEVSLMRMPSRIGVSPTEKMLSCLASEQM
jgi:hypothetical protein